uniref:Uncharacterized protein n=1 Tax=Rhizophora mucronata TaxID=61149 RepID=A0A2P2NH78_RHIMU
MVMAALALQFMGNLSKSPNLGSRVCFYVGCRLVLRVLYRTIWQVLSSYVFIQIYDCSLYICIHNLNWSLLC